MLMPQLVLGPYAFKSSAVPITAIRIPCESWISTPRLLQQKPRLQAPVPPVYDATFVWNGLTDVLRSTNPIGSSIFRAKIRFPGLWQTGQISRLSHLHRLGRSVKEFMFFQGTLIPREGCIPDIHNVEFPSFCLSRTILRCRAKPIGNPTGGNQRGMQTPSALHACGSQSEQSPQSCL
jgi:hypothetical protein